MNKYAQEKYERDLENYEKKIQKNIEQYNVLLRDSNYCISIGLPANLSEAAIKALSHSMTLATLGALRPKLPSE